MKVKKAIIFSERFTPVHGQNGQAIATLTFKLIYQALNSTIIMVIYYNFNSLIFLINHLNERLTGTNAKWLIQLNHFRQQSYFDDFSTWHEFYKINQNKMASRIQANIFNSCNKTTVHFPYYNKLYKFSHHFENEFQQDLFVLTLSHKIGSAATWVIGFSRVGIVKSLVEKSTSLLSYACKKIGN